MLTFIIWVNGAEFSKAVGVVAVMGKYLVSTHLYSTICELNTLVLGFDNMMGLLDVK
jgi:hypothetical protein